MNFYTILRAKRNKLLGKENRGVCRDCQIFVGRASFKTEVLKEARLFFKAVILKPNLQRFFIDLLLERIFRDIMKG
jgi:hypothetical protein